MHSPPVDEQTPLIGCMTGQPWVPPVSLFTKASGLSDLAQVRYLKAARSGSGGEESISHWIATVQFAYVEPAKDPMTRRWNPLCFKIVDFRTEPEIAAPAGELN